MPLSMWIFNLGCNPYVALTHVHSWLRLSFPITLLILIVSFGNFSTHFSFYLSSTVPLVTLVHRNDISSSMSGHPFFLTTVVFHLWIVSYLLLVWPPLVNFHLYSLNLVFCDDNLSSRSSLNNSIDSSV